MWCAGSETFSDGPASEKTQSCGVKASVLGVTFPRSLHRHVAVAAGPAAGKRTNRGGCGPGFNPPFTPPPTCEIPAQQPAGGICHPSAANHPQAAIVDSRDSSASNSTRNIKTSLGLEQAQRRHSPSFPPLPLSIELVIQWLRAKDPANYAANAAPRIGEPSVSSGPNSKSPAASEFPRWVRYYVPPPRPAFACRRFLPPRAM